MEYILRSQSDILRVQNELMNILPQLATKPFKCEITRYYEKRSLNANKYFHLLCDEIAKKLNTGNDEIKIKMNLEYGHPAMDADGNMMIIKIPRGGNIQKFYCYAKYYQSKRESKGNISDYYIFYKPTHELDKKEMARLIDGVVSEAKELGIETRTPEELAKMKSLWEACPQ